MLGFDVFAQALTFVGPRALLFLRADIRPDDETAHTILPSVLVKAKKTLSPG